MKRFCVYVSWFNELLCPSHRFVIMAKILLFGIIYISAKSEEKNLSSRLSSTFLHDSVSYTTICSCPMWSEMDISATQTSRIIVFLPLSMPSDLMTSHLMYLCCLFEVLIDEADDVSSVVYMLLSLYYHLQRAIVLLNPKMCINIFYPVDISVSNFASFMCGRSV